MNSKRNIIIAAGVGVIVIVFAIGATLLLRSLGDKSTDSATNTEETSSDPQVLSSRADTLREEAKALAASDPEKAGEKYSEAEQLYKNAGNEKKASEARLAQEAIQQIIAAQKEAQAEKDADQPYIKTSTREE